MKGADYLDISMKIRGALINTSIYNKPTDSFNYLHYDSCHPTHTKDNIAISLAKRIIRITSDIIDRETKLDDLKNHLMERGHPASTIDFAFTKLFTPQLKPEEKDLIIFKSTFNPRQVYRRAKITKCLDRLVNDDMKETFNKYKVMCTHRQPKSLRNLLIKSRFDWITPAAPHREVGLFSCDSCVYCKEGLLETCKEVRFGQYGQYIWRYTRKFTCNSVNIIYLVICGSCWEYYIGQTKDGKKRVRKHKSDVFNPQNSYCREFCDHVRKCSKPGKPLFKFYPLFYEDDENKRRFMEKRFILRFKPPLNRDS